MVSQQVCTFYTGRDGASISHSRGELVDTALVERKGRERGFLECGGRLHSPGLEARKRQPRVLVPLYSSYLMHFLYGLPQALQTQQSSVVQEVM